MRYEFLSFYLAVDPRKEIEIAQGLLFERVLRCNPDDVVLQLAEGGCPFFAMAQHGRLAADKVKHQAFQFVKTVALIKVTIRVERDVGEELFVAQFEMDDKVEYPREAVAVFKGILLFEVEGPVERRQALAVLPVAEPQDGDVDERDKGVRLAWIVFIVLLHPGLGLLHAPDRLAVPAVRDEHAHEAPVVADQDISMLGL